MNEPISQPKSPPPDARLPSAQASLPDERKLTWLRLAPACGAMAIGASVLLGWALHLPQLTSVLPNLTVMKPNTALCVIAAGLGLLLMHGAPIATSASAWRPAIRLATLCGALTLLVAILTLAQYLTGQSIGLDEWLFTDPSTLPSNFPGRMAPMTAIGLVCIGLAIVCLVKAGHAAGQPGARWVGLAHGLAVIPAATGYLGVAGYAYAVDALHTFGSFASIALNTAVSLLLLATAVLLVDPLRGWSRGFEATPIARSVLLRLLPILLLLPFVTGALVEWGGRIGIYDPLLGPALFVLIGGGTSLALTWLTANAARDSELRLAAATAAREAAEARRVFLQELTDNRREDPQLALSAAMANIGRYFSTSRTGYGEVSADGKHITIAHEHTDGTVAPASGTHRLADFGAEIIAELRAGRTLVIEDVVSDARTQACSASHIALGTRSVITVPLRHHGRLQATLYLNHRDPRIWLAEEVSLIEAAAGQLWSAIDGARAQAALQSSEQRLRLAMLATELGSWDEDLDTGHTVWNESAFRIFSLPPQTGHVDPRLWRDAIHPADRERVSANFAAARQSGTLSRFEHRIIRADGEVRWVEPLGRFLRDANGRPSRFVGVFSDVTARKSESLAVLESETRFRTLAEVHPGFIFEADPDGANTYTNQRFQDYAGFTAEQLNGDGWIAVLHPDDRARAATTWGDAVRWGTAYEAEYRFCDRHGVYRWFLCRGAPQRDPENRIQRWHGVAIDITEIVEARDIALRQNDQLERRVAERTRELEETQTRLAHAQRMEALGQLAGGVAHDFNNVLQAVQGAASLMERRADDAETVRRLTRMAREAVGRGSSITRRLLAFSRRDELKAEVFEVAALLAEMHEILAHTLGAPIHVDIDVAPGLPPLLADKGQLETVVINMATNARDAMPGGGRLTLSASLADVAEHGDPLRRPAGLKPGRYVLLGVTDTGCGMTREVLERVAEPFFTTKERGKGTGLGTAMAKGFAEQSGGGFDIESALGEGTTVRLWFPAAALASADDTPPPRAAEPAPQSDTSSFILVVDDEALVRELMAEGLAALGFRVRTAQTGEEALTVLDDGENVSLLVSDLSMPGMNGLMLIREAQRRRPDLPAILLTGHAGDAATLAISGAVSGSFSLLRKPVTPEQLAERATVLLEGVRLGRRTSH